MADNPYKNQSSEHFWSTGVRSPLADGSPFEIASLISSFGKNDRISSVGSCFAQYIGKELEKRGFNYHKSRFSGERVESFGIGNAYTTRQFKQWLQFGLNLRNWSEQTIHQHDDGCDDYLLPHKETLPSAAEIQSRREKIAAEIVDNITNTEILIFTLGLTEAWQNASGDVYPACPGTLAGVFDGNDHSFINLDFADVLEDLNEIQRLTLDFNPNIKLVLTVSPVPLTATATSEHVLVASAYSKSTLRAAAGEFTRLSGDVAYFPSFELITHNSLGDWRFAENLRTVSTAGVEYVMAHAFGESSTAKAAEPTTSTTPKPADEAACEEQLLEAYNRLGTQPATLSNRIIVGDSHCGKIAEAMTAGDMPHIGGMIMNGSGFSDTKFELCETRIFIPQESEEAAQLWEDVFGKLSPHPSGNVIYTNIGFQTHRTIADVINYFSTPLLTYELVSEYFKKKFRRQVELLKGLSAYGQIVLVEDPNFYPFFSQNRDNQTIFYDYNFDIYCAYLKSLATELGFSYFKPSEKILRDIFKETGGVAAAFSDDTFHGSQLYYEKLAKLLDKHSRKLMNNPPVRRAA